MIYKNRKSREKKRIIFNLNLKPDVISIVNLQKPSSGADEFHYPNYTSAQYKEHGGAGKSSAELQSNNIRNSNKKSEKAHNKEKKSFFNIFSSCKA